MAEKKQPRKGEGRVRRRDNLHENKRDAPRREKSITTELPTGPSPWESGVKKRVSSVKPPKAQK